MQPSGMCLAFPPTAQRYASIWYRWHLFHSVYENIGSAYSQALKYDDAEKYFRLSFNLRSNPRVASALGMVITQRYISVYDMRLSPPHAYPLEEGLKFSTIGRFVSFYIECLSSYHHISHEWLSCCNVVCMSSATRESWPFSLSSSYPSQYWRLPLHSRTLHYCYRPLWKGYCD